MPALAFKGTPSYKRLGTITTKSLRRWTPSLAIWGFGAGLYATYFLSVTPLVKRELLTKIPVVRGYYEDDVPAEDKPF